VLVCVSFEKRNAVVGDDGAAPVSAGGSESSEFLAAARQVDAEVAVRVVDVQQAPGDNRARSDATLGVRQCSVPMPASGRIVPYDVDDASSP
jgi:hypothetical protein